MGRFRTTISASLDGYVAGPEQSIDDPLGIGGERLHDWALANATWRRSHGREGGEETESSIVLEEMSENVGAVIMGRNMFGGGPGPWDAEEPWTGWWGDEPPFHNPVFVLTHHARESLPMDGGTTFHFVTDGIEPALAQAREAAGDQDVLLSGGGSAIDQYLAAGLLDEIEVSVVPVILGAGTRLFDGLDGAGVELEQVRVITAPAVTHIRYRVAPSA